MKRYEIKKERVRYYLGQLLKYMQFMIVKKKNLLAIWRILNNEKN